MVHVGSHVDVCAHCDQLKVCAELWNVEPRFRMFICAACLQVMADAVRQAMARYPVPQEATVR